MMREMIRPFVWNVAASDKRLLGGLPVYILSHTVFDGMMLYMSRRDLYALGSSV